MAVISIKEKYLIVDRGGAAYVSELGHDFKTLVSIHISRWCVIDCPVQWDVEVDISGLLIGLVYNDGQYGALTVILGKYK